MELIDKIIDSIFCRTDFSFIDIFKVFSNFPNQRGFKFSE